MYTNRQKVNQLNVNQIYSLMDKSNTANVATPQRHWHKGFGEPQQQVATTWRGQCRPPSGLQVLPKPPVSSRMPAADVDVAVHGKRSATPTDPVRRDAMQHLPVPPCPMGGNSIVLEHARINVPKSIRTSAATQSLLTPLAGCSEHLQGDSGWNARRVPLSTEISRENRRLSWRLATLWFIDTIVERSGSVSQFFHHPNLGQIGNWKGNWFWWRTSFWASSLVFRFGLCNMLSIASDGDVILFYCHYVSKICINLVLRDG